jgi:hypothetical protein
MLWCVSPNVIAWGSTICPDTAATSLGAIAGYTFWCWLKQPDWNRAIVAGLTLGVVELTKTTWILLFVLWPLLWLMDRLSRFNSKSTTQWWRETRQLATALLLGVYLVNLAYGFEDSFLPLKTYRFISQTLGGNEAHSSPGNRFTESMLGNLPVPFPRNYTLGMDTQKYDFEIGKWSYLCGEHKKGGWWYYYLFALLIKEPVGTWLLAA